MEHLSRPSSIPIEVPDAECHLLFEQAARGGGVELGGGAAELLALSRDAATDLAAFESMCGGGRGGVNVGGDETVGNVLHSGTGVHI